MLNEYKLQDIFVCLADLLYILYVVKYNYTIFYKQGEKEK